MSKWEYQQAKMNRDEALVHNALSAYRDYDDGESPEVAFTPTHVLYETYLEWMRVNERCIDPVIEKVFGRLLRKALGVTDEKRQFRRYKGSKRCWGYLGLTGPGSIRVLRQRGRRTDGLNRTNTL